MEEESKHYYSISEVSKKLKLSTSLIRFWEKQFDIIKIKKNSSGFRLFSEDDIKNISLIKYLLKDKQYTIEGAKKYLLNNKCLNEEKQKMINNLVDLRSFLKELSENIDNKDL